MSVSENQIPIYVLQPEISGQIKQTTLEEIKIWINDGELQPHHQVRIRNLSWVEARNVPTFKSLFESKKNDKTDQPNNFFSQPLPDASAVHQNKSEINKANFSSKETTLSTAETALKTESKPVEPSAVFKAYEKKALAKSKQTASKTKKIKPKKVSEFSPEQPKKSPVVKKTLFFLAGCILMLLLSSGGSYLWVYQLKSPAEFDEKSLPELAGLEHKLTSEKLDLRLKPDERESISGRIAQLEKKYDTQRKTAVENHRVKLKNADFTATFSFSSAALLTLFFIGRIFYGKTSEPVEKQFPPKPPAKQSPELSEIEEFEDEFSENSNAEGSSEENDEESPAKTSEVEETTGEISDADHNDESNEATSNRCSLHRKKIAVSVCEGCESSFCDECFKSFGEPENSCPFCNAVCKSIAAKTNKPSAQEKKKVNLLELGKDSDFIVYEYEEERSRVAGVIQAFVIALLFSAAVSILWVYKISPYLENRNQETAQIISPNKSKNSEQANNNSAETAAAPSADTDATGDKPCIDPETGKPFECDAETRRALFEHTRKVESVEKAKKQIDQKTKLLNDSEGSSSENTKQEDAERKAAETKQKGIEKQQLVKVFLISFVIIFGILLAIIFLSKDKKTFLAQDDQAES